MLNVIDFVSGSYASSSACASEMIAAGIILHTEDASRAGGPTYYDNLFDYSGFNHSYDIKTTSATAATDRGPVGASWPVVISTMISSTDELKIRINNPVTNGMLSVSMEWDGRISASIIDLTGRTRITKKINEARFDLDVSTLEQGFYLLHLDTGNSVKTIKFVKY